MPRYPNHALPLRGAADLKVYALCRRPPKEEHCCDLYAWELHFDILDVQ